MAHDHQLPPSDRDDPPDPTADRLGWPDPPTLTVAQRRKRAREDAAKRADYLQGRQDATRAALPPARGTTGKAGAPQGPQAARTARIEALPNYRVTFHYQGDPIGTFDCNFLRRATDAARTYQASGVLPYTFTPTTKE